MSTTDPVAASETSAAPGRRASGELPTMDPADAAGVPLGRTHRLSAAWWYTAGGLLFVVVIMTGASALPLLALTEDRALVPWVIVLVVAALAGQLWACLSLRDLPPDPHDAPSPAMVLALLVPPGLLVVVGLLVGGGGAPWLPVSLWSSVVLLSTLSPAGVRTGVLTIGGAVVLAAAVVSMARAPGGPADSAAGVALLLVVTLATLPPTVWFWRLTLRLEEARRTAGGLAVARERLRFAAELHDVQGHHLQVIALKAELAERLLARGREAEAAAALREVRQQAADALGETRALVRDLRAVSLEDELENAAEVLRAAGADVTVRLDPERPVPSPSAARLLGLAAREATTNALRHADPAHAEIALAPAADGSGLRLTVRNDGLPEDGPARTPAADAGTGLASLAERAAGLGGTLTARRSGAEFTTTITVPAGAREERA